MMPHRHLRPLAGLATVIAVAAMPSGAKADAVFTVGGKTATLTYDGGAYTSGAAPVITAASGGRLTDVTLGSIPDPLQTVSANFTDGAAGGTEVSGAVFVPTGGLVDGVTYTVYGSLGITITNGTSPPSSIGVGTVIPGGFIMQTYLCSVGETNCVSGGVDLVDSTVTSTSSGEGATRIFDYDYTTTLVASSAWDEEMGISLDYVTSGFQSAYGISAAYVITPIAEPMSITLLGGGLVGMIALRRRRQYS